MLTSVMLLSTILTPQMAHALASMQDDGIEETVEDETSETNVDDAISEEPADNTDDNSSEGDSAEVTDLDGETNSTELEDETRPVEDDEVVSQEPEVEKANSPPISNATSAFLNISPMAALEGNYVTGFSFNLVNKDGSTIDINKGETVINPTNVDYAKVIYDFTFPENLVINTNSTFEITLPDVMNVSARTGSIQPANGPLVNYEVTAAGKIIFTFTDDWNNDVREMRLDMQTNLDVQLFEEQRKVEVNVPYVDGEGFHAVLVGPQEGVEGSDVKTGNTFNAENEKTKFRPEYAEWTIRVNDQLKVYNNASIIDTLSKGHSLDTTSIEVYRIPRNYLTGAVTSEPVLIDPSEYTLSSDASNFNIGFGSIEDTYEIRYRTNIDYETVESETTINNTARIILDGDETTLEDPIDLQWGNDFDPIVKSGEVDPNDKTKINWEVRYNFASHSLGDVTLTDLIDIGTVDLSTVEVFEVGVDGNGNPVNETSITVEPSLAEGSAVISIPDSNGKSYVIRFTSDVPGNYAGSVTNNIDDNNSSTPPGKAVVEVNTSPGGDKSGTVKYGDDGIPYIEWNVEFNTNRVAFDDFSFTDTFNGNHLQLVKNSFVLTHSGGANLTEGTEYSVTPSGSNAGFTFTLNGESEKEVYTLTYRTNYTLDGIKEMLRTQLIGVGMVKVSVQGSMLVTQLLELIKQVIM